MRDNHARRRRLRRQYSDEGALPAPQHYTCKRRGGPGPPSPLGGGKVSGAHQTQKLPWHQTSGRALRRVASLLPAHVSVIHSNMVRLTSGHLVHALSISCVDDVNRLSVYDTILYSNVQYYDVCQSNLRSAYDVLQWDIRFVHVISY